MAVQAPRPQAPEPIDQPVEYQRFLVGLVAGDDPARVQEATLEQVLRLVVEAGDRIRTRPEPGEWSVVECLGHILDAELVSAGRYRWAIAHDEPHVVAYDQDRWVDRLHHAEADPRELVEEFSALRRANLALWRRLTDEEKARVYIHAERGAESVELAFHLIAGHDRFHLAQARWALANAEGEG